MPSNQNARRALIRFLQRIGAVTAADAPGLEEVAEAEFGPVLARVSGLDAGALAERLVTELRIERFDPATLDPAVAAELPADVARRHGVVLVRLAERTAHVAMANPLDLDAIKDVEVTVHRRTHALVATPDEVRAALDRVYPDADRPPHAARPAQALAEAEAADGIMAVVRACLDRIDEVERRLEREHLPPPPDPAIAARLGTLETAIATLRDAQQAAQEAHRDQLARLVADQDALVAAQGAAQQRLHEVQREVVDVAVRRIGEILLPRLDELAAGVLESSDRADRAQRTAEALGLLLEEVRAVAAADQLEPMRGAVEAVRFELATRLGPLDDALTALATEQAAQGAELTRLVREAESLQRRTEGSAAASELRGLEAEVMAMAAQLHRTAQGVEWARAGLAEARNEIGKARELAEGARRVAEAAVTAGAVEAVREALDARLRQVATQVARYEAGLGRLSGAQGDLEEALARVRAVAEEARRLTGTMATVERTAALEAAVATMRSEVGRIAHIVDAPAPGLIETAWALAWRGMADAWRAWRWITGSGRA